MPDDVFYHVDSWDSFETGQVITLNEIPTDSITSHIINGERIPENSIQSILSEYYSEGLSFHGLRYTGTHPQVNPAQINQTRKSFFYEQFLENIRLNHHPSKLSRFQAFFACKTVEDAKNFADKYRNDNDEVKIWKVKGEAKHKGDYQLTELPAQYGAALQMAMMYWRGESCNKNPFWEYLLRPPVKVLSLEENYSPSNSEK